jgi:hypothetical protein
MRRPRHLDFECGTCGFIGEVFVETNDDNTPLEEQHCAQPVTDLSEAAETCGATCGAVLEQRDTVFNGYMKTIVKGSHDYNDRERERLEKRSDEHWKREGRHEAIERERSMLKKNGMEGAGGVR